MLVRCERCQLIQGNQTWRCQRCRAMMPEARSLIHLLALAAVLGLGLIYLAIVRLFL